MSIGLVRMMVQTYTHTDISLYVLKEDDIYIYHHNYISGRGQCRVYYSNATCGVVWCGVVWCGVVWCGLTQGHLDGASYNTDSPNITPRMENATIN